MEPTAPSPKNTVRILDTTIRDGGYMVNHHYSAADVATIAGCLDQAGLPYIEVGYGMGLFADEFDEKVRPKSLPSLRASGHAKAALAAVTQAKVGVLFVAGQYAVPVERIKSVAELGFSFVRLAVMPDEYNSETLKYIRAAKDVGLTVSVNLMQTDIVDPAHVGEMTARAADHGLDWFSVVDSAGGMSGDDVKRYVSAVLERADVSVGLHSHNNTGRAVCNSIAAVEAGATLVDGTLNGMGRSTGNSPTELLAITLRDRLAHHVDLDSIIGLSRSLRSLLEPGDDPFHFVSGGGGVHSRDVAHVKAAASARGRSPAWFLLAAGPEARRQKASPSFRYPDSVYDTIEERVPVATHPAPTQATIDCVRDDILGRNTGGMERALRDLRVWSQQRHLPSVLHLSKAVAELTDCPVGWEDRQVGISVPWGDLGSIDEQLRPDFVVVDEGSTPISPRVATLSIPFEQVLARAAQDLALALHQDQRQLWTPTPGPISSLPLCSHHLQRPQSEGAVMVLAQADQRSLSAATPGDYVLVLGGTCPTFVDAARKQELTVLQPDWARALASLVSTTIAARETMHSLDANASLVPPLVAPGSSQVVWDERRASIRGKTAPAAAAAEAARRHIADLWAGKKSF